MKAWKLNYMKARKESFDKKGAKMWESADVFVETNVSFYDFNAKTNFFVM